MKGRAIVYLPEELAWIEARKNMPRAELHALFCAYWQRNDVLLGALGRWSTRALNFKAAGT